LLARIAQQSPSVDGWTAIRAPEIEREPLPKVIAAARSPLVVNLKTIHPWLAPLTSAKLHPSVAVVLPTRLDSASWPPSLWLGLLASNQLASAHCNSIIPRDQGFGKRSRFKLKNYFFERASSEQI
jgi:hypothetical protein